MNYKLLVGLFLENLLFGCASVGPFELAPKDWQAYKIEQKGFMDNPDINIKLKYPPTWKAEPAYGTRGHLSYPVSGDKAGSATIYIGCLVKPEGVTYYRFAVDTYKELNISNLSYTSINGGQAMVYSNIGNNRTGKILLVDAGDNMLLITVSSYESSLITKQMPTVDSILQTIKW